MLKKIKPFFCTALFVVVLIFVIGVMLNLKNPAPAKAINTEIAREHTYSNISQIVFTVPDTVRADAVKSNAEPIDLGETWIIVDSLTIF